MVLFWVENLLCPQQIIVEFFVTLGAGDFVAVPTAEAVFAFMTFPSLKAIH